MRALGAFESLRGLKSIRGLRGLKGLKGLRGLKALNEAKQCKAKQHKASIQDRPCLRIWRGDSRWDRQEYSAAY